ARFDLTLALEERDGGLDGVLEHSRDLFDGTTVRRLVSQLGVLLATAVAAPDLPLEDVPLLAAAERHQIEVEWNDTASAVPRAMAHQLFEEQARRAPDAPALRGAGGEVLSYRELNGRADRLARLLRRRGVGPEVRVALALERSPEAIIALLAVLKAGGAFVPLDPAYPAERLAAMLADSRAPLLLTREGLRDRLPRHGAETLCLDSLDLALDPGPDPGPPAGHDPDHLAYVIYTSGSTGRPKGVEVAHRGLVNLTLAIRRAFRSGPGQRVLLLASLSFDAAVAEIFMALGAGACLHVAPPLLPGPELLELLAREEVTIVTLVPAALAALPWGELPRLETLVVAGEACPPELAALWRRGRRLLNAYGPTEITVCASIAEEPAGDLRLPIGRPLPNVQVHVLDGRLEAVPAGVPGELYVGGISLARGYLGQPDRTAERFVPDPLGGRPGGRLYRTGDLGRRLADGTLDFLGRADTQVKVRGFRIELGEIEAVLAEHPAVQSAAAVVRDDLPGGRGIAAYAVPRPGREGEVEAAALRELLAQRLPPYMVPAALMVLAEMPLQPNGKADRRALPAPGVEAWRSTEPAAPRTPAERRLAAVWAGVLGLEAVGIHDDFFALGGHSLLAIRLAHESGRELGVEVPASRIFETPTVAGLAGSLAAELAASSRELRPALPEPPRRVARGAAPVPASFAQRRLWLLDQLDPGEAVYNLPVAVHIEGRLGEAVLERSLGETVRRHEALRTTFTSVAGEPVQVIAPAGPWRLPVVDLTAVPGAAELAGELAREEARRPFDLARGPLLRAVLLRLGGGESILLLNLHHIVSDAWSMAVLVREIRALCAAFDAGVPSPLPEPVLQYADFSLWQRQWMSGGALAPQLDFWRAALRDLPALTLPVDRPLGGRPGRRAGTHRFLLPARRTAAVTAAARRAGATPAMVLLAAFEALLGGWTGEEDFGIGIVVANRRWPELDGVIGFFVNTLVLRVRLAGDPAFGALLERVREGSLAAYAHQELPFERLVEELAPERPAAGTPFFRVAFSLQNVPLPPLELAGAALRAAEVDTGTAKFDLALALWEGGEGLTGQWTWMRDGFDTTTILRLHGRLEQLLAAALADPAQPLSCMPLLDEAQQHQIVREWGGAPTPYPRDACVHELFERQAARTPEAVAVALGGECLTYRELDARASRLAWRLVRLGVGTDDLVGLCAERSPASIVALLAILKAGGAYLPLDPALPADRKAFLIADAGVVALLVQERFAGALPASGLPVARIEEGEAPGAVPAGAPRGRAVPESLAYVLYTSGSTGRPKGVEIPHRAVVRLVCDNDFVELLPGDVFLHHAPLSFDASTIEIWGALLYGLRLELLPPRTHSLEELAWFLTEKEISVLFLTAGLFHQMVERHAAVLRRRRHILAGGDVVSPAHVAALLGEPGRVRVTDCYGPTESTTFASFHPVAPPVRADLPLPIGRPIANTRVCVLDRGLRPVATGTPGELLIGGDGLARGYWRRPGLTAERFVPDPLAAVPGERLYHSGDLVRHRADGAIDYLGRIDRQLKIRGFRIEPGEVEAALLAFPAVRDALVMARRDRSGDRHLAAYVAADAAAVTPAALRAHLRDRLPEFMLPAAFAVLPELPLTANGKVDRDRLPAAEEMRPPDEAAAARTPAEELLAGIWADLLGRPVGVRDDFFEIGGHSLLATQAIARVREVFGVPLPLRALFETPTVEALAVRLAGEAPGAPAAPLVPVPRNGDLPASFAQERLWFLDQLEPASPLYNVAGAWLLSGPLDPAALERSLAAIVERHEALRTTFAAVDGRPVQVVHAGMPVGLPLADLGGLPAAARAGELARRVAAAARRPFDLTRGPLLRVCLVRLESAEHALLVSMHHIVSDGWSVGVFARELAALYSSFRRSAPAALPALPVQYPDFALWQREWLRGAVLAAQLAVWRQALAGAPPGLDLPVDRPRRPVAGAPGASLRLEIGAAATLEELGRRHGATLFMVLLAGWAATLARSADAEDVVVGSPVANRSRREIEGLIGFFVNTLPLRVDLTGDPSLTALLARVRAAALAAYSHQDVPFERLVEELLPQRDPRFTPLFNVMLTLDRGAGGLELPGLLATPLEVETATAKAELVLALERTGDGLRGRLEYRSDLLDATTVRRLADSLALLLEEAAAAPESPLSCLPALRPAARQQLLREWNDTASAYPRASLPELFARCVRRSPEAPAVQFAAAALRYAELDRLSDALARRLLGLGVRPGAPVGLCLERSAAWVVGMLGILKAGGAYVPLDLDYPAARLAWMLEDSGAAAVVAQPDAAGLWSASGVPVVVLDGGCGSLVGEPAGEPAGAPGVTIDPGQTAYVIYTSGSTGRPKGVAVPQRAVVRLLFGTDYVDLGPGDRLAQVSNGSFDAATFEVWGALLHGGCLVGLEKDVALSPRRFAAELRRQRISAMFLTTSLFNQVAREVPDAFAGIRCLLVGGEALDPRWVREVLTHGAPERLSNAYGPTESTTFASWHAVREVLEGTASIPIGRPLSNTRAYVLDRRQQPVPLGARGELCLGGDGLALGYHARPALTAERFIPDPFAGPAGGRLYRTGDLVRLLADGAVEFLGRIDQQVKIRGFRIEPGEVEAALRASPVVRDGAVVVQAAADGGVELVAYAVPRGAAPLDLGALRTDLAARLPAHMMPAALVALAELPLTPNGKLDRRALPRPDRLGAPGERRAPRSAAEERIARVWADLLGFEHVGIDDDFFALGGHSLLATQAVSRLREALGIEVPLRDLFEAPTVAGLAERLGRLAGGLSRPPLRPRPEAGAAPLSFAQSRLWFLQQLQPASPAYNMPLGLWLRGPLDAGALERALGEVVRRHAVLRSALVAAGGLPVQVPEPAPPFALPRIDLRGLAGTAGEAGRLEREEALRPFDLARPPLLRGLLLRTGEREHLLLVTVHHAACDGWSLGVLMRELGALYGAFAGGQPSPLPELPVQYADFAVWQRDWLQGEALAAETAYWRGQLDGGPPLLELPADRPRDLVRGARGRGGRLEVEVSERLAAALAARAREWESTRFMTLLAGFVALLHRSTGESDLVIGSPIANRNLRETEGLIGFFVNTLALRVRVASGESFAGLAAAVREVALGAYAHQDLPFETLIEELRPERRLGQSPLFEVMFGLYTAPPLAAEGADGWHGLALEPARRSAETSTFELTAMLFETAGRVTLALQYDADLFDRTTISRLARRYEILLCAAAAAPEQAVEDLPVLAESERHQMAFEWNDTASEIPRDRTVHALFAEQARRGADRPAVLADAGVLTYGELDRRANRVARRLRALGVAAECPVGLCLERSPDMIVATLAILKAGSAYVPLAPEFPRERLAWMIADAGVEVVVTRGELLDALPFTGRALCLDRDAAAIAGEEESAPADAIVPFNLAYVMYTSGSTGLPKRVGVSHGNVVRLVRGTRLIEASPDEVFLQSAPISFDGTTFEIWGPLLNGGRTALLPPHVPTIEELAAAVERFGVSTLWLTAGLFQQMVDGPLGRLRGVRRLLAGGDVLSPPHVARARRELPGCLLFNGYGPTENTTGTATHRVERVEDVRPGLPVPIGRPLANTEVHLLDARWRAVPVGVPGELCVGGEGVARGYLGRPELTAEKLVPHPLWRGERLYRTGDLARWLPAGALEFLGRIDRQVKIRGFRVEPGEVEEALLRSPGVRAAAVDVRRAAGERRLVAYVVPHPGFPDLAAAALRGALREILPDALLPSAFVLLDALPLTTHGKVDRRRLPEPVWESGGTESASPASQTEEILAGIWGEVLELRRVGVHDDFFTLGGHSLMATRVASRVREAFGLEIPLRLIFEEPTVARLAAAVERERQTAGGVEMAPPIVPVPRDRDLPLSFAQQRLWFLDRLQPDSPFYNLPSAVLLRGRLRPAVLAASFGEIVRRHEALRTRFPDAGGVPVQRVEPPCLLALPLVDLGALPEAARGAAVHALAAAEARRPFRLSDPRLVRTVLLRLGPGEHVLLLTMHHIISDGWSIGVLLREMAALYAAVDRGEPSPLPELPVQYPDFAWWQRRWLQGETLARLLAYWRGHLAGAPATIELPYDRPHPAVQSFRGAIRLGALSPRLAADLQALGRRSGATLFMTLLSAFGALLHRYSGNDDLVVGTPTANRNRREVEGLIGFFVNTLALRLRCAAGESSFRELLGRTALSVLDAQAHQDLPFEKLVEELRPLRDLSRSPLFQVMLILQNAPVPALELPGLSLAPLEMATGTSRFELTLSVGESGGGGWTITAEHNTDLFDAATIDRLLAHLGTLLAGAAERPETRITDLPLLGTGEVEQLLRAWSGAAAPAEAGGESLGEQFVRQARRTPERVAVVAAAEPHAPLTYGELSARSSRLARRLRGLGVGPEVPVGVLLERTPDLVVGLLAILRAGGAYVPLDPAYPEERLAFMLADSRAPVVLVDRETAGRLAGLAAGERPVLVDFGEKGEGDVEEPWTEPRPDLAGLAYVIYTSGSTGRPKGVAITHAGAVALLAWSAEVFAPADLDGVVAATSICFDLSVFELFAPLTRGGRVILVRDGLGLLDLPGELAPTLINTVPSVAAELARAAAIPPSVRTVNLAGEPLHRPLVEEIYRRGGVERVLNLYGPSEDTTYSTVAQIERGDPAAPAIGRPVTGTRAYVAGPGLDLLPAGMPGELCLAGSGLARGYLHRPELTAERFLPDPFAAACGVGGAGGERLYRTGDRVRWRPDGALEFLGRIDHQVKVRGFRVELGEVEAALREHPAVVEAAVAVRAGGGLGGRLVAYLVPSAAAPAGAEELATALRSALRRRLPEPMIPAAFVVLERLPLSPNGKVDRRALPEPAEWGRSAAPLMAPRNDFEKTVAAVWCEVLEREGIGIHDNFFESGGHSLLAVRAASRLQEVLGRRVSVLEIFEHPTVASLAAWLPARDAAPTPLDQSRSRATARRDALRQRRRPPARPGGEPHEDFSDEE
ncbi:MAG TPA: non-ribosomal peptide synthase/polyketide synthase, partial [Thermoanaerobaculia bacterium]|nr:non-ribosomal peptide synthase/polyketide synthase [Thermoanaerobaculia bacterium]